MKTYFLAAALALTPLSALAQEEKAPPSAPIAKKTPSAAELKAAGVKAAEKEKERRQVQALLDYGVPPVVYGQDPNTLTGEQKVIELYTLQAEKAEKPGDPFLEMMKRMLPSPAAPSKRENPTKTGKALLELLQKTPDAEVAQITKLKFFMLLQALSDYANRADQPRYQAHPELLAVYKQKIDDVLKRQFAGDKELAGLGKSSNLRAVLKKRRETLALAIAAAEKAKNLPADKIAFMKKVVGELNTLEYNDDGSPLIPSTLMTLVKTIPEKNLTEDQWRTLFECYPMGESLWLQRVDKLWRQKLDGSGIRVAILDTGVDKNHPFLKGDVVDGRNFTAHRYVDKDNPNFGKADNRGRHGTHVASTVLAIAPQAEIVNLKVLDEEAADQIPPELKHDTMMTIAAIKNGLAEVWQNNETAAKTGKGKKIDIVSMSLGIPGSNTRVSDPKDTDELSAWVQKLAKQGVIVIVAAGNESADTLRRPAVSPDAITVGAVDYFKRITNFSSDQTVLDPKSRTVTEKPDVWAYGDDVHAAKFDPKSEYAEDTQLAERMSGTSMATPHVAGITALLVQEARKSGIELTPAQVKKILQETASAPQNGNPFGRTGGVIEPAAALAYLRANFISVAKKGSAKPTGK